METINFGEEQNNSAPKAPRNKKLILGGVVLAVLILAVISWQYWQYAHSMYYQQMQGIKYLEKMAKESDKYGGKTPEETVALFSDAIKKGDFELAAKYGDEEKVKSELEKIKTIGKIDLIIKELEIGKIKEILGFGGNNVNLIAQIDGIEVRVLSMYKSDGGTWKIVEF